MEPEVKKPYHCNICGKEFMLSVTFKAHTVLHEREAPYKCSWCGKIFKKNSIALKDHMRDHLEKWELRKKLNDNKEKLAGSHSGELPYSCSQCGRTLSSSYNLEKHLRLHTGEKPFKCNICSKEYTSKESLKIHSQKRHTGAEPSYICELCGEKFDGKSALTRHSREHKSNVVYQCKECGNHYRSKKVLDNHIRVHAAETINKNFQVDSTTKKEIHIDANSNAHTVSNGVEKKYTCFTCGKNFPSHKSVLNHMFMHTKNSLNTRPCKVCGIAFLGKRDLDNHVKREHNLNSKNIIYEALENMEKVTLYIKEDDFKLDKVNGERQSFTLGEKSLVEGYRSEVINRKGTPFEANRKDDVMVIDENIVIDVEEVIIEDKNDVDLETEVILHP